MGKLTRSSSRASESVRTAIQPSFAEFLALGRQQIETIMLERHAHADKIVELDNQLLELKKMFPAEVLVQHEESSTPRPRRGRPPKTDAKNPAVAQKVLSVVEARQEPMAVFQIIEAVQHRWPKTDRAQIYAATSRLNTKEHRLAVVSEVEGMRRYMLSSQAVAEHRAAEKAVEKANEKSAAGAH